jgi:hypothetical protein
VTRAAARWDAWFRAHPRSVGESWAQHCAAALRFAVLLARAAAACFVHALAPALFTRTASGLVAESYERLVRSRARLAALGAEPDWAI